MSSLSRRLRLARLALRWEGLAPGLTALASLCAFFLSLALFDGLALLPGWLHAVILAGFAGAALALLVHLLRLPKPSEAEASRRLERDSGVFHRPLAVLDDHAASGDPALWQAHRQRMEALAQTLRPGWPDPVLPARDPHALRFAALLLLVVAASGSGSDWPARLGRALNPAISLPGLGPDMLEVWITPPAYTGLAPRMLRRDEHLEQPLSVAQDSQIKAVLSGGWGDASLLPGPDSVAFLRDPSGSQRAEASLTSGTRLAVRQGWRDVASWPVTVIRDALPSIAFMGQPEGDPRGRLLLNVQASDDYGLARTWVEIQRLEVPPGDPSLNLDLPLPGQRLKSVTLTSRLDLAAHDWAGSPVLLIPHAEDGAGQSASGEGTIVTLPERVFRHKVARALILWRREISDAPRLGPDIAEELGLLLAQPGQFGGDSKVFLALALTRRILMAENFDRDEARDLLWAAATRLEDGAVPVAEQALEQARQELEQALADNAPAPELAELLNRVQAALEKWLAALAETGGSAPPPSPGDRVIGEEELAEMLGDLRDMAETGNRDALRQRLAELSALLSQLGQIQAVPAGESKAAKDISALRDLARRQQEMLEQSFQHARPLPDDQSPPPASAAKPSPESRRQAQAQRALGDALRQLAKGMGEPSAALEEAARAMAGAEKDLGHGDWPAAAEEQGEALRLLKDGGRDLVEKMAAARGQGRPGGMAARDPFGRSLQGQSHRDDGSTKVATPSDTRRARQILDELRRRVAEPGRAETEMDYLRRLLKQF